MTKQNKINTAYVVVGCYRLEGEEGGGGRKGGCGLGGEKQGMAQAAARQRRGEEAGGGRGRGGCGEGEEEGRQGNTAADARDPSERNSNVPRTN